MLLNFRVANVLSFRDEQRLSFVATELNDGSARPAHIRGRGDEISVVPTIGIYGANASGKTAMLEALRFMRDAVVDSLGWFSESNPVRRIAFALDPKFARKPSFYEVDIALQDGVRYTYGLEIDDDRVRGEWLHAEWPLAVLISDRPSVIRRGSECVEGPALRSGGASIQLDHARGGAGQ